VRTLERDVTRPLQDLPVAAGFDRVLVDAPCSGLGTLRRNPDARWRIGPDDPARLAEVQRAILRNAAATLRPGGVLVYSTCTLLPEENEAIVDAFLREAKDFRRAGAAELPAELAPVLDADGNLRCLPHRHDTDGFFAARLERQS
jgi:16S rRNA (cytosine967-C5)-methyltransferase